MVRENVNEPYIIAWLLGNEPMFKLIQSEGVPYAHPDGRPWTFDEIKEHLKKFRDIEREFADPRTTATRKQQLSTDYEAALSGLPGDWVRAYFYYRMLAEIIIEAGEVDSSRPFMIGNHELRLEELQLMEFMFFGDETTQGFLSEAHRNRIMLATNIWGIKDLNAALGRVKENFDVAVFIKEFGCPAHILAELLTMSPEEIAEQYPETIRSYRSILERIEMAHRDYCNAATDTERREAYSRLESALSDRIRDFDKFMRILVQKAALAQKNLDEAGDDTDPIILAKLREDARLAAEEVQAQWIDHLMIEMLYSDNVVGFSVFHLIPKLYGANPDSRRYGNSPDRVDAIPEHDLDGNRIEVGLPTGYFFDDYGAITEYGEDIFSLMPRRVLDVISRRIAMWKDVYPDIPAEEITAPLPDLADFRHDSQIYEITAIHLQRAFTAFGEGRVQEALQGRGDTAAAHLTLIRAINAGASRGQINKLEVKLLESLGLEDLINQRWLIDENSELEAEMIRLLRLAELTPGNHETYRDSELPQPVVRARNNLIAAQRSGEGVATAQKALEGAIWVEKGKAEQRLSLAMRIPHLLIIFNRRALSENRGLQGETGQGANNTYWSLNDMATGLYLLIEHYAAVDRRRAIELTKDVLLNYSNGIIRDEDYQPIENPFGGGALRIIRQAAQNEIDREAQEEIEPISPVTGSDVIVIKVEDGIAIDVERVARDTSSLQRARKWEYLLQTYPPEVRWELYKFHYNIRSRRDIHVTQVTSGALNQRDWRNVRGFDLQGPGKAQVVWLNENQEGNQSGTIIIMDTNRDDEYLHNGNPRAFYCIGLDSRTYTRVIRGRLIFRYNVRGIIIEDVVFKHNGELVMLPTLDALRLAMQRNDFSESYLKQLGVVKLGIDAEAYKVTIGGNEYVVTFLSDQETGETDVSVIEIIEHPQRKQILARIDVLLELLRQGKKEYLNEYKRLVVELLEFDIAQANELRSNPGAIARDQRLAFRERTLLRGSYTEGDDMYIATQDIWQIPASQFGQEIPTVKVDTDSHKDVAAAMAKLAQAQKAGLVVAQPSAVKIVVLARTNSHIWFEVLKSDGSVVSEIQDRFGNTVSYATADSQRVGWAQVAVEADPRMHREGLPAGAPQWMIIRGVKVDRNNQAQLDQLIEAINTRDFSKFATEDIEDTGARVLTVGGTILVVRFKVDNEGQVIYVPREGSIQIVGQESIPFKFNTTSSMIMPLTL